METVFHVAYRISYFKKFDEVLFLYGSKCNSLDWACLSTFEPTFGPEHFCAVA
jgi:hypothetical protein